MSGPPPPPPVKLVDTSLKIAEVDPCFKESAQLERKVTKMNNYNLTSHERAHIPTDFPDVVSLSSLTHVLALVGPFARYDAGEIAKVKRVVKDDLCGKVERFKALGDTVNVHKDLFKQKKPVDLGETRALVHQMKTLATEIEALTAEIEELVLTLREQKSGFRPESLPSVERKTFPKDGADWMVGPITAYIADQGPTPDKSIKEFVKWCKAQMHADADDANRRAIMKMVVHMAAFNENTGLLNTKLVEARVKEYIKYFKSSLPAECILR